MADTPMTLADMIVPEIFHAYTLQQSTVLTAFWQSGVVTDMTGLLIDQLGGTTIHMPFFNDIDGADEVVDDADDLSIAKTSTSQDVAVKLYRARVYGGHDLAADLAGADPMNVVMSRFGEYWARRNQDTLLAVTAGAMGALATEGKNSLDISGLTGGAAVFDGESFLDAKQTLGDHAESLAAVAMHSATYTLAQKQDLIDFVRTSDQGQPIPYYMGKRVIVTDAMPVANGVYTTYLFGPGAIGYGEKAPKVPVEPWREPLKGGGLEYIVQRRQFCLHPRGVRWNPKVGVPDKATPSNAELADAGNWQRVFDPKLVRIVQFKHKIA